MPVRLISEQFSALAPLTVFVFYSMKLKLYQLGTRPDCARVAPIPGYVCRGQFGTRGMAELMLTRSGRVFFALIAAALAAMAFWDVHLHGRLTLIDPQLLGALAIVGTGFLLFGLISARDRATEYEGRTDRLAALTDEFEAFIAALEAANARLNASEARYKGLVDAQGDAILRRTPDGRLTYANEAFFKLFGVARNDVIGQAFRPELHPESPPPIFGRLAGRETGLERVRYDQHVKTVAGFRWFAWEDYAIRDATGRLVEVQSVGRDITERKALEAALMEARDKAEEANHAKSRFLATMSHEIRTPMNGVLGMARLLTETPLDPDQHAYAEAIYQSGTALLSLIEGILDFSKIESGAIVLDRAPVRLRPIIEDVNELLATRAHAKGIEIAAAIAPNVPELVHADANRLRQVLTNLVGNAIKFTESGGVLVSANIEPAQDGALLRIAVRDTGIGVPAEKCAAIFDEFVQGDASHAHRFEGTGLGLAISKRLVEAMGGKIGVNPAEDRGSVFWFTLPLEEHSKTAAKAPVEAPLAPKRAGLISASPVLRASIKLQLEAAGMEMVELQSLESGPANTIACDVVLLDAGSGTESLPDVSGLGAPVAVLLPPKGRAQLAELAGKGIAFYLMKPVRQAALEKRLRAVLAGENETKFETPPIPQGQHSTTSLSVLLAEDNPVNALLMRELLRRRGHSVDQVATGDEAVMACALKRYDLVVMDIHMPGLDGIEATRRIRAHEQAAGLKRAPIFALTADVAETGRRACLEAGMDGFLTKPVDPDALDGVLVSLNPPATAAA
jgi:PAS domain S-box-containing protein